MATTTKDETVSVRITAAEKRSLEADALRKGIPTATVAASYIAEGLRRSRFPAVEFRNGSPGRVAYLAGTRWPVWLIVQLVKDYSDKVEAAAKHMNRPPALVQMALDYAAAYPEEIDADLQLAVVRHEPKKAMPRLHSGLDNARSAPGLLKEPTPPEASLARWSENPLHPTT
jgi:hypothetical protein